MTASDTMTSTESRIIDVKIAERSASPLHTQALSLLRFFYSTFYDQNPLMWAWTYGRRNPQADMEGPYYMLGSPSRMIGKGKGVLSTKDELNRFLPFLVRVRVLDPEGKPAANVTLDWWQADGNGDYYFRTFGCRGKFMTDEDGCVEVLTVAPKMYGVAGFMRVAHVHLMLCPSAENAKNWDALTTQMYVCPGNETKGLSVDVLNIFRRSREQNVLNTWSIPEAYGGKQYMDLPALPESDGLVKSVAWWNEKLATHGDYKIIAAGRMDIKLNARSGWF